MAESDTHDSRATSYTVVARRYRPQTFDELIGQEHVAKALTQAIVSNRVGHAYLFTGARGVGKTSAARVLAKALNCVDGPTATPCNKCDICLSVTSGDDVDVIEIDGASNNGVDEIRELRQNANVRASRARYKIYIIDEVHMLSKSAFNALLKTLEEPPEHVKFIFATTEANKIPITILSRCQRFDFAGIDAASIERRLQQIAIAEGVEIDDEALAVLAMRAAGSMRDSQSLLEQLLAVAGNRITADEIYTLLGIAPGKRVQQIVAAIVDRNAAGALAELDEALGSGADVGQVVDQLLGYLRDVMAMVVGCDATQCRYVLPSQHVVVAELAERLGVETVLAMIQCLDQTSARMRISLHPRTLAEMAVVRLAHLDNLDDLSAVIAQLQTGVESGTAPPASGVKKNVDAAVPPPHVRPPAARVTPGVPPHDDELGNTIRHDPPPAPRDAPAPPAMPSGEPKPRGALDAATLQPAWRNMIAGLEGLVATQAELAGNVRLEGGDRVIVTFSPDNRFSKDYCENEATKSELEQAFGQQLGQPVSLRFVVDASLTSSQPTVPPVPRAVSRRQLQTEVSENAFVRKAIELFDVDTSKMRVTPPKPAESP